MTAKEAMIITKDSYNKLAKLELENIFKHIEKAANQGATSLAGSIEYFDNLQILRDNGYKIKEGNNPPKDPIKQSLSNLNLDLYTVYWSE